MDKQSEKLAPEEEVHDDNEEEHVEDSDEGEDDNGSDENSKRKNFGSPDAAQERFDKLPKQVQAQLNSTDPAVVFNACLEEMNSRCRKTRESKVDMQPLMLLAQQQLETAKKILDTMSKASQKDPTMETFVASAVQLATSVLTLDPEFPKYKEMWERCTRTTMYAFRRDVFQSTPNSGSAIKVTAPKELVDHIKSVHAVDFIQMMIDFVKLKGYAAKKDETKTINEARELYNKDPQNKKELSAAQRRVDMAHTECDTIHNLCNRYVELRQRCEGTWSPKKNNYKKRNVVTRSGFRPNNQSDRPVQRDPANNSPFENRRDPQQHSLRGGRGGGRGGYSPANDRQDRQDHQTRQPYQPGRYQMMQPVRQPMPPSSRGGFRSNQAPQNNGFRGNPAPQNSRY